MLFCNLVWIYLIRIGLNLSLELVLLVLMLQSEVPKEVFGDDCTAMRFWKHFKGVVGRGGSPESAMNDLVKKLKNKK